MAPDEVYELKNAVESVVFIAESFDSDSPFIYAVISLFIGYIVFELGYGLKPVKFTNEKHFRRRGYESICTEFQTLKIVFVGLISFMMTAAVWPIEYQWTVTGLGYMLGTYTNNIIFIAIFGVGFRILTHFMHKEFRYYLAKGYCITATKKEDDFEKTNNLSSTLDSYNKFLRRRTQIEIKDVKRIHSTFLTAEMGEKNQIIKSVCESLESDRLGLARYLSKAYKVTESEFFVEESIIQKMKGIGTFLAAAIPIIVSIIALINQS
jgi:hypothetical protein